MIDRNLSLPSALCSQRFALSSQPSALCPYPFALCSLLLCRSGGGDGRLVELGVINRHVELDLRKLSCSRRESSHDINLYRERDLNAIDISIVFEVSLLRNQTQRRLCEAHAPQQQASVSVKEQPLSFFIRPNAGDGKHIFAIDLVPAYVHSGVLFP